MGKAGTLKTPNMPAKNLERAGWVETGLRAFCKETGLNPKHEDWDTIVGDFITDLRHFCDREGLDLMELIDRKAYHYKAETRCFRCRKRLGRKDSSDDMDNLCNPCLKKELAKS